MKDAPEKSVRKSFSQAFTANVVIEHASAFGLLELTEQATLVDDPDRPDVLVSGALHGDESVGPTVTLELARWLLLGRSAWQADWPERARLGLQGTRNSHRIRML